MKHQYSILLLSALCFMSCVGCDNVNKEEPPAQGGETITKEYQLVWQDEFDDESAALSNWWFETGNNGWGNNEPQNYVDREYNGLRVAEVKDGQLIITAHKLDEPYQGSDYISARMNTKEAWLYGKFEMRAKLPGGRGTWAAFWMMPKNFKEWPLDGEIDIMEYVGYRPNVTQTSIHTQAYNHKQGTEKTKVRDLPTAETEFHVYSLEWTKDEIIGFVDNVPYFVFKNDTKNTKETWPFNQPFYLKLNLAIGGDWGGLEGIDPDIFPAKYVIDYVRVYQEK